MQLSSLLSGGIAIPDSFEASQHTVPYPRTITQNAPTNEIPFVFGPDASSNHQTLISYNTTSALASPSGRLTFCWPFAYNDSGTSLISSRAFSVLHYPGNGGMSHDGSRDDSAIMGLMYNLGPQQTFHQFLTFYGEAVLTGNPTFRGHAGGEASVSVYRGNFTDSRVGSPSGAGFYVYSGQFEKQTTIVYPPTTHGVYWSYFSNEAGGNQGNGLAAGYLATGDNLSNPTNYSWAGFVARPPTSRFPGGSLGVANVGIFLAAFSTNAQDYNLFSDGVMSSGLGKNIFAGPVIISTLTPATASDPGIKGTITFDSNFWYVCVAANTWKRVALATW